MSSSTAVEPTTSTSTPPSPALRPSDNYTPFQTSTPNFVGKKQPPLSVVLPNTAPSTPTLHSEPTLTPPPRSPGANNVVSGNHPPDGTSSDKSSETAVAGITRPPTAPLTRKESYKAQRQHYRREKKRVTSALLNSIDDPSVVVLADFLKVRGSLKSWTKLWCVLKPGLLLLYKSNKGKGGNHWVGTVLLTSCQVIERPSKKDGFCFKLYHPLEQSIWAPRGPHNETIGAVVQPLPTSHLIFRSTSQEQGHCWLDGLEVALRCSNAMLRCSRSRPEQTPNEDVPNPNISHEELEKHFNEHVEKLSSLKPITSISCYNSPNISRGGSLGRNTKQKKTSKWSQFVESIEKITKDIYGSNDSLTQEIKHTSQKPTSSSKFKFNSYQKIPILKNLELPKLILTDDKKTQISPTMSLEENLFKFVTLLPKRRSSTPKSYPTFAPKRISELRSCGSKTDSENDEVLQTKIAPKITKTAPSMELYSNYSTSSTDDIFDRNKCRSETPSYNVGKFSLINYDQLPSTSYEILKLKKRHERFLSQNVHVSGKVVSCELAGAASDSDSEVSRTGLDMADGMLLDVDEKKREILNKLQMVYTEDLDRELGSAGELVEEVADENKSLIWFLMKQVRPGMDLSKVVLPTFILEPRSFLDKLADNYYHADILSGISQMSDPYIRFTTVLKWYLSGLYKKPKGLKKPYNPVLGETFRCFWKHPDTDSHTFYVSEQVSHHPPVSAFYVANRRDGYTIEGSLLAKSKFFGNSTSAILEGCARISLLKFGETYITTAPYAHCKGIVIGTLTMELGGKVHIFCNETGYSADIEFKLRSFLSGPESSNAISGRIKKGRDTVATVEGNWDGRIDIKKKYTDETTNLLDVSLLKEQRLQRYLVKLDQQQENESQRLWLRVSEAILNDDQIAATEQKTIIEEAQRNRAKNQISPWKPQFFHKDPTIELAEGVIDQGWRYNNSNNKPWEPATEILEYEDNYIIKSLTKELTIKRASEPRRLTRGSDSDSHCDLARRSKTSSRSLKQAILSMEASVNQQKQALDNLTRSFDIVLENQRQIGRLRQNRQPMGNHSWDLFSGFVLAIILQAVLNWLFYSKN